MYKVTNIPPAKGQRYRLMNSDGVVEKPSYLVRVVDGDDVVVLHNANMGEPVLVHPDVLLETALLVTHQQGHHLEAGYEYSEGPEDLEGWSKRTTILSWLPVANVVAFNKQDLVRRPLQGFYSNGVVMIEIQPNLVNTFDRSRKKVPMARKITDIGAIMGGGTHPWYEVEVNSKEWLRYATPGLQVRCEPNGPDPAAGGVYVSDYNLIEVDGAQVRIHFKDPNIGPATESVENLEKLIGNKHQWAKTTLDSEEAKPFFEKPLPPGWRREAGAYVAEIDWTSGEMPTVAVSRDGRAHPALRGLNINITPLERVYLYAFREEGPNGAKSLNGPCTAAHRATHALFRAYR